MNKTIGVANCVCVFLAIAAWSTVLPSSLVAQAAGASDSARAAQILASMRGANPVVCELAMQSIDRRYGNWGRTGRVPDGIIGQSALVEWVSKDFDGLDAVPLLGDALSDEDTCVRRTAARLLGRTKRTSAIETLQRRLGDSDARTRQAAAVGLGYANAHEAVGGLMRALEDQVAAVRAAATWALGEIEDERSVEALTRMLSDDPDPFVRRQAAWALGNMY